MSHYAVVCTLDSDSCSSFYPNFHTFLGLMIMCKGCICNYDKFISPKFLNFIQLSWCLLSYWLVKIQCQGTHTVDKKTLNGLDFTLISLQLLTISIKTYFTYLTISWLSKTFPKISFILNCLKSVKLQRFFRSVLISRDWFRKSSTWLYFKGTAK